MTSIEPTGVEPVGAEPVGAEPVGAEPVPGETTEPPLADSHFTRQLVQGLIALLLVAAVIIVAIVVVSHNKVAATHSATGSVSDNPTPKNMASYGVLLTGGNGRITAVRTPAVPIGHPIPTDTNKLPGTAHIVEYIDYQCPYCLEFERANLSKTAALVASGKATLEIHPVAFLDRSSQGTRYSSRAFNAAACVANYDPDTFLNVTAALYQYQPAEGSTGLTNAQILNVLDKADATSAAISKCVDRETYRDWVTATTADELGGSFAHVANTPTAFEGTPTVFVNGAQYTGSLTDAAAFSAFVAGQ
jgi:protein-disulfide isomerase